MTRLVSGVIDAARDYSKSFDPKTQPPGPLYRVLADFCVQAQTQILAIDPSAAGFEVTLSYDLPLADHDAGLALGANRLVSEIVAVDPSTATIPRTHPVALILRSQRHAPNAPPLFAWQEGSRLYLRGPSSVWTAFNTGSIQVRAVQGFGDTEVAELQAPAAVLPLPDEFARAASAHLAAFMGMRSDPPIDLSGLADAAMAVSMQSVVQRLVGTTVFTQDDWQP